MPSEPAAVGVVNADAPSDLLLVCDHASNRIPQRLGNLGLSMRELESHIAWDPGALPVARALAAQLRAPLVYSNYSRLVIDCNRPPGSSDSIAARSDGTRIPGNRRVAQQEALLRRRTLFDPYHATVDGLLRARAGKTPFLLSIHSFTAVLEGRERPWPIGVCYADDVPWAEPWLTGLQAQLDVPVGDNQPYAVEEGIDYTLPAHVKEHGVPAIMLELRQDDIRGQASAELWADTIANAWRSSVADAVRRLRRSGG